jgi:prepilin-type N-terminal cleavage/methylation domain-containing protein
MSAPNRPNIRPCPATTRHAFTLIEVLIATVIIALGALGLLALFAGAAAQQQASSRTTLSSFITSAAESGLVNRFGKFATDPNNAASSSALAAVSDGVWRPLTMDAARHTLLTPPGTFSLVDASPETLFSFPGPTTPDSPGQPEEHRFVAGNPTGIYGNGNLRNFSFGDIEPESLDITISISGLDSMGTRINLGTLNYSRVPGVSYDSDEPERELYIYTRDGSRTKDPRYTPRFPGDPLPPEDPELEADYVIVDVSLRRNQSDAIRPARIYALQIPSLLSPGNAESRRVESIVTDEYEWRDEQLVTLRERIVLRPDASSLTGTRPDLAYSVLYKRDASTGSASAAIIVYQLTAASSRAEYLPREQAGDVDANRAPIRRTTITLGENVTTRQQFIRTQNPPDAWITSAGQIVVFEGDPATNTPGADGVYRVIRQEVRDGTYIGYLDRAPRFRNRAVVSTAAAQSGQTVQARVFGIAESVTSRSDSSVWTLRPVEARVFQVPISQ